MMRTDREEELGRIRKRKERGKRKKKVVRRI